MESKQRIVAMPLHDPAGVVLPRLLNQAAALKRLFGRAVVTLTVETVARLPGAAQQVGNDPFFALVRHENVVSAGEDFRRLYERAAGVATDCTLHLCFPDRLLYALHHHADPFGAAVVGAEVGERPLQFVRSAAAWASHPANYRRAEARVTLEGERLFGRRLDYAWCHLVLRAGTLRAILPALRRSDISIVAEVVLALRDTLRTVEVDWLAWEDPFILGRDAAALRAEREQSPAEERKRLDYVLPMLDLLHMAAVENGVGGDGSSDGSRR